MDTNRAAAQALGWTAEMFGVADYGRALTQAVKAFQAGFVDLVEDGVCGPSTWRRLMLDRAPDEAQEHPEPERDTALLYDGALVPIQWPRVVLPDAPGGLGLERGYREHDGRTIDMVITHWDVCVDAHACAAVLRAKGISTHLVIDWDGTIYQLVDLAHEAWHAGIGWINRSSIGVDFNTPVYPKYQAKIVKRGQPERPIVDGWRINGWRPGPILGVHPIQLRAYEAILAALSASAGVPLASPGGGGANASLGYQRRHRIGPGVYHHAEVDYPRRRRDGKVRRSGKWDCAGVCIPDALDAARALLGG